MVQVWPASAEYATLALTCQATTSWFGFPGFTAIEGSLKKPGLGLMSVRWAFGAGGNGWASRLPAQRRKHNAGIFISEKHFKRTQAGSRRRSETLLPIDFLRKPCPQLRWIHSLAAQCLQAERIVPFGQADIAFVTQQWAMKI